MRQKCSRMFDVLEKKERLILTLSTSSIYSPLLSRFNFHLFNFIKASKNCFNFRSFVTEVGQAFLTPLDSRPTFVTFFFFIKFGGLFLNLLSFSNFKNWALSPSPAQHGADRQYFPTQLVIFFYVGIDLEVQNESKSSELE